MSEDDIDSLIVAVTEWLEEDIDPDYLNDDRKYDGFRTIFYEHLEKFCTKERNYN